MRSQCRGKTMLLHLPPFSLLYPWYLCLAHPHLNYKMYILSMLLTLLHVLAKI